MPDFSAKMHQIQFRLGCPRPHSGSPLAGWVRAVAPSPRTHPFSALRASIQLFQRLHHLSPLNQKVKLPMCPRTPRYPLLNWYPTTPTSVFTIGPCPPLTCEKISHRAKNATLEKLPQLFCIFLCYIHKKTTQLML